MAFYKRTGRRMPVRETAPPVPMFVGRPQYTGSWQPGIVTHPMHVRHWQARREGVNGAVSTVPQGRWQRGTVTRHLGPAFDPPLTGFFMYDPTLIVLVPGTPQRRGYRR